MLKGAFIAWAFSALIGGVLVFSAGVMAAVDSGVIDPSDTARVLDIAMRSVGAGPEAPSWRSIAIMTLAFCFIFREQVRRLLDIGIDLFKDGLDLVLDLLGALFHHDDDDADPARPTEQAPPGRPTPSAEADDAERLANIQRFERGERPHADAEG